MTGSFLTLASVFSLGTTATLQTVSPRSTQLNTAGNLAVEVYIMTSNDFGVQHTG